jgi:hypothetical protein
MREKNLIYADGAEVEAMILKDAEFRCFHDGYVDSRVQEHAEKAEATPLNELCRALRNRTPPKLLHQVAVLREASHEQNPEYALFRKDKVKKIKELAAKHKIADEFWIWEDLPKDVSFESLGPFIPLSQVGDLKPEETAELIRIRTPDGQLRKLVDDQHSIIHHLSKLRLQMSRLYLAKTVDPDKLEAIKKEVQGWAKPD